MKQFSNVLLFMAVTLMVSVVFVSATPQITIISPQPNSYDSTKIALNVTSNEPVDFFIKTPRGLRSILLAENVTAFDSYLYVNEGEHEFTIWANNSNGESNATVIYSSTIHNPVNITNCGILSSPDTEYVLENDINAGNDGYCMAMSEVRNVSFNLNGYTISASDTYSGSYRRAFTIGGVSNTQIFNGTVNGSSTPHSEGITEVILIDASRTKFSNLNISGMIGFTAINLNKVIFEDVHINSSVGMYYDYISDTYFINSSFIWNGNSNLPVVACVPSAFCEGSYVSEIFLEETNISGFPEYDFHMKWTSTDFYLRNTKINLSRVIYPAFPSDTRFFTQHLGIITTTDLFGRPQEATVRISDSGTILKKSDFDIFLETLVNPTSEILTSTDENGRAEIWLTEKLTYAKTSSPAVVTEYDFSPYNVTVISGDAISTTNLSLTGLNSTIPMNFSLNIPVALPTCTIAQMLDLTGNGIVDISDKNLLQDYLTGKTLAVNGTKQCEGINMLVV